jgi:hypothetical protein
MASPSQKFVCPACGFTNPPTTACGRCGRANSQPQLPDQSRLADFPDLETFNRKLPIGVQLIIAFSYILSIGLGLVGVYGAVVGTVKLLNMIHFDSGVVLGISGLIGFVTPVAICHFLVDNWKTNRFLKKRSEALGIPIPQTGSSSKLETALRIVQIIILLGTLLLGTAVSGILFQRFLPSGQYPVLLLALPALVECGISYLITETIIERILKNRS